MNCPNCQTKNPEGYGFCMRCGNSLLPQPVCYCHHVDLSHRKFCSKCGATLVDLPSRAISPFSTPPPLLYQWSLIGQY
ncbi:zinc-ribbon domain-containing protein [Chloroflexota bacterium]